MIKENTTENTNTKENLNKNTDIKIKINDDSFANITSFNSKNSIKNLDLMYLPFNKFSVQVSMAVDKNNETIKRLEDMAKANGLSKKDTEKAIKVFFEKENNDIMINVLFDNRELHLSVESSFKSKIKFNTSEVNIDKLSACIDSIDATPTSSHMVEVIKTDAIEKEKFDNFVMENLINVIQILMYILADRKVVIEKDDLYSVRKKVEKVSNKKKSKGGKKSKRSNVSIIRSQYVYEIPKEKVVRNTEKTVQKKYERHVDEWFSKGYWRKNKNGTKSWVRPSVKRSKNAKEGSKVEKTYIIE